MLLSVFSCTSVRVGYDYNPTTDFSNYFTYNYFSDMNTGLNDLDTRRLLKAVDSILPQKGLRLSEEPDFLLNIQSSFFYNPQRSTVGVGVGGTNNNVGGGISIGVPVGGSESELELVFDFVDTQKNELFWQAVSSLPYRQKSSPSTWEKQLTQAVIKIFSKYPPTPAKGN